MKREVGTELKEHKEVGNEEGGSCCFGCKKKYVKLLEGKRKNGREKIRSYELLD
jgi:hypothetical protein